MFIGRNYEIVTLQELYQKKLSNLVVVYGRRRVGKSSLIQHFSQKKLCLKFEGLEHQQTHEQIQNFVNDLIK